MKIFLIRHGESTSDVEDRFGGVYDDDLTERGLRQALKLSNQLKNKNIEYIYYSPFKRAKSTAKVLMKELNIKGDEVADIRERNSYGVLSGLTKNEANEKYPKEFEEIKNRTYLTTIMGATNYSSFKIRVINAFIGLIEDDKYSVIAIVTHGGPISCIFRELIVNGEIKKIGDCSCMELGYVNNKISVDNLDDAFIEGSYR